MVDSEGGLWDSTCTMSGRWELIGYRCEDCDEAFAFCSLCCVCVWRSERAEACLAAIAGTYASADMAGEQRLIRSLSRGRSTLRRRGRTV